MRGKKKSKSNPTIASEWDKIAHFRHLQLLNKEDISMDEILIPLIFKMIKDADFSNVIDLGCGTGYTAKKIYQKSKNITGIDISRVSIEEAKNYCKNLVKAEFFNSSIEEFAVKTQNKYSLAISNMTYMDVANLEEVIKATSKMVKKNGNLVITVTHPYFWPFYWNYANKKWFNYTEEIEIEDFFTISSSKATYKTTHFHRPLEAYINNLTNNKFTVEQLYEPFPSKELDNKYPIKWKFPRFLGIRCKKV